MGSWKQRKRALPWKEPFDARVINWFLNRSFWKSVAVNVVSAAIIAMGATFVLSIAIYEKANFEQQQIRIAQKYAAFLVLAILTVTLAVVSRRRSSRNRDRGATTFGMALVTGVISVLLLLDIWSIQITNLVNTIEITEFNDGTHISSVFTYLRYDDFGNPRYMNGTPYRP
jgi:uncharacterized membrane protein YhaH (DUF805 family)